MMSSEPIDSDISDGQSASEAIDAGKQFAKETANKVSIGVSELATKASDSVASGLAWVESIFAPKKKK